MMRSLSLIPAFILLAAAPLAAEDKPLNMLGTWVLSGQGVAIDPGPGDENWKAEPKVSKVSLRYVIDKQQGAEFWGMSTDDEGNSERILGEIAANGKIGIAINERGGYQRLTVLDADTIEGCYVQKDAKHFRARCAVWVRQR